MGVALPEIGDVVNVLEVVSMPDIDRVRARIEAPAGWMSLRTLGKDSNQRWAEKMQVTSQSSTIELTISYATSGDTLAKVKLSTASTVACLKNSLKKEIGAEKEVQKLLLGDKVLQEHQSFEASGLVGGAEVKAIVGSKPVLFVGESQASWGLFDEDNFPDD